MRSPVSYLLVVLGGPLGYIAGSALTQSPDAASTPVPAARSVIASTASASGIPVPPTITGSLEGSTMVAEWERLNAAEGSADFAALYTRIKATEDPFRRRAFRAAALSDWVARDPKGTLLYLRKKDNWMATQFAREWLRTDPNAAIDQLLADGPASRGDLGSLLEDIAKLAPGRLAEICAKTASTSPAITGTSDSYYGGFSPAKAFAVFAAQDLDAARAAALGLTGTTRDTALAGVGGAWAEKDGVAALAWAESLPPGSARDAVLQRVLAGWAKTDPFAALGKIDLIPKDNGRGSSQNNAVSQVLAEASRKDWTATMAWLQEHPEKSGSDVAYGLTAAFTRRLRDDPVPMLRDIASGAIPVLSQVFGSAIANDGYAQRDAVWTWLQDQPKNPTMDGLRTSVLTAVAYKDPSTALDLARDFPASEENHGLLTNLAQCIFNSERSAGKLDEWYDKASPALRPYLVQASLHQSPEDLGANAPKWVARLTEMPADLRSEIVPGLAGSWAASDPEAARKWALSLSDDEERLSAFRSVAQTLVANDDEAFAKVLETLPRGAERDAGTAALSQSLLQSSPEVAWDWASEIQNETIRLQSLQQVYGYYAGRNRAAADELLNNADLSEAQIKQFEQMRDLRAERYGIQY